MDQTFGTNFPRHLNNGPLSPLSKLPQEKWSCRNIKIELLWIYTFWLITCRHYHGIFLELQSLNSLERFTIHDIYHLEAWAQTPTAHPALPPALPSSFCLFFVLIVFPTTPSQAAMIFKPMLTMCGLLHFIWLILLVFSSSKLCIIKLFIILSVQFLRCLFCMWTYLYYIVILIVCYYVCCKCRNKTKLKMKLNY